MVVPDPSMVMATMISPHEVQAIQANLMGPHSKIPRIISKSFVEFNPTDPKYASSCRNRKKHTNEWPSSSLVSVYRVSEERMIMAPFDAIFNDYEVFSQYFEQAPKTEHEWQRWAAKLRDLDNIDQELQWSEDLLVNLTGRVAATARPNAYEGRAFPMRRDQVNELQKSLFLMTSLWNKDRKNHLLKKDPIFKYLNSRMREWKRAYN